MRNKTLLIIIFFIFTRLMSLYSQQNEKDIAENTSSRLSGKMDFGEKKFSEKYRVIDSGGIYFDLDEKNRKATLYFNQHPIFRFKVRIVDHNSENISIAGKEYVLTGNNDNRIIIDKAVKRVFLKKVENSGSIMKVLFSTVTISKIAGKKIRFLIKDNVKITIDVNNHREKKYTDFYFKNILAFSLDTEVLKVNGKENRGVWIMKGNAGDEIALNKYRKSLYFRNGHPKGSWAKVEEI